MPKSNAQIKRLNQMPSCTAYQIPYCTIYDPCYPAVSLIPIFNQFLTIERLHQKQVAEFRHAHFKGDLT